MGQSDDDLKKVLPDFGPRAALAEAADEEPGVDDMDVEENPEHEGPDAGSPPPPEMPSGLFVRSIDVHDNPMTRPMAFDPGPVELRPYQPDPQDALLPPPGFITDFVYSMKGKESPVIFNYAAALYAVSVAAARKAYFKWAMGRFFPNLYVLIVGPPAGPHKGAAMGRTARLLDRLPDYLVKLDPFLAEEKRMPCLSSRATSEGIYKAMVPKRSLFILPDGHAHTENFGSRAYVWAPEFATFLNSKKYTEGLVDALTNWYDCLDKDTETLSSRTRKPLKDIYFCLAGALTPAHISKSLPAEAFTGGFMSRVLMVCQERPFELWPEPVDFSGYPDEGVLLERLAWLSFNNRGEYDFTPEARRFYRDFYMVSREKTLAHSSDVTAYARLRHEHLVIRVAMLIRMCEYREGRDVTVDNLRDAMRFLDYIYACQSTSTEAVGVAPSGQNFLRLRRYMIQEKVISRRLLQKRFSKRGVLTRELDELLRQLHDQGEIAFVLDGKVQRRQSPSTLANEEYHWTGTENGEDNE